MNLPPLNALRSFECAARHLSFSKAGDELCVTHAAISHQIKQLETWFDRPLFERLARGVKLTPAGRELFEQLDVSLPQIARTCERIRRDCRIVRVGCIPSITSRWLIPALPEFSKSHPEIQVSVLYARSGEQLEDSDCDLLITHGGNGSEQVVSQVLFSRSNHPVCSPHYLAGSNKPDSPSAILASDLLHDESERGWRDWALAAGLDNSLLPVQQGTVFQDANLLMAAAIAGHGIALCPVEIFCQEIERGDLVILSDQSTPGDSAYTIARYRNGREAASVFADWFTDFVGRKTRINRS